MKISLNWIRDYIDLDESLERIEEALTLIGFEVESVEQIGLPPLENCVIGKILTREQHPNADRLGVCSVDVGDGTLRQIVCGATNYQINDLVPVALPGCILPGDFTIKRSKLRGVESEGMMCSARELGLGEDHAGLMILSGHPRAKIGRGINDVLTDSDIVFDVEVTPNRPDCLSHIGLARELAAYFDLALRYPAVRSGAHDPGLSGSKPLIHSIHVVEPERCPYYSAFSIAGVRIGPSPDWLRTRLEAIGQKPINNVVDVTNYVLHELGQPLHAFDRAKISGDRLVVRLAEPGETLVTLDDKERKLPENALIIADDQQGLVIAGIMGSADAEVDQSTADIVLEAAYFEPTGIRKTSRQLTLSTDSAYRFERGVDAAGVEFAALRAVDLILQTAGGHLAGQPLIAGGPRETIQEITLKPEFIRQRLGFGPDDSVIQSVLERLELEVTEAHSEDGDPTWTVSIPSFRNDLERPVDLVEEFLRIYGTDQIPKQEVDAKPPYQKTAPLAAFVKKAADTLIGQQFAEAMSLTLRSASEIERWLGHANVSDLMLANPLTSDQTHLRPTLIPGLLDTIKLNASRNTGARKFFETGRVFRDINGKISEAISVAFVIYDDPRAHGWRPATKPDFFTVKAQFEQILNLARIHLGSELFTPIEHSRTWMHGHSATIGDLEKHLWQGKIGLIDPRLTGDMDIDGLVYAGSILICPEFFDQPNAPVKFRQMSPFPCATKDIALIVDATTLAETLRREVSAVARTLVGDRFAVESVSVFDTYQGPGVPEGKKSLGFSIAFRAPDRTLGEAEITEAFDGIVREFQSRSDIKVRS